MPARLSGSAVLIVAMRPRRPACGAPRAGPAPRRAARTARPTCPRRTGRRESRRALRAGGRRASARATAPRSARAPAGAGRRRRSACSSVRACCSTAASRVVAVVRVRTAAPSSARRSWCGDPCRTRSCPARRRSSTRSPEKPSDTARPAATSTPIAWRSRSPSSGTPAARSLKNDAPRLRSRSSTARASSPSAASARQIGPARSACHASACSRRKSAIGVADASLQHAAAPTAAPSRPRRRGTACRASPGRSDRAAPAAPRAPTRRPAARSRRAARPPRAARRARSASSLASTCCHSNRNRMKSAGVTGSISARSRFSV